MPALIPLPVALDQPRAPLPRSSRARLALFAMLGVSAGLPFTMFSSVLQLRLMAHGAGLAVIGFFVWVTLLPTAKFAWAPLMDRLAVPGFGRWGHRMGWILLSQGGIAVAALVLALDADDSHFGRTALWAVLLAFWTTTLEVSADAWRIEQAPTEAEQGPLVAANVWGYRTAMVAAGSGALIVADHRGWAAAYLLVFAAMALPLPLLIARQPVRGSRLPGLAIGLAALAVLYAAVALVFAAIGLAVIGGAGALGVAGSRNITPVVLGLCFAPFLLMALAIPRIRTLPADHRLRRSPAIGPFTDFFWRFDRGAIAILAFVSLYRMGDVLALALAKPLVRDMGYSLTAIGTADVVVALGASMAGVATGGWLSTRWPQAWTLTAGAVLAALGNWAFVWLYHLPPKVPALYLATAADQFANGFAGTVFVVYLSLLVNPRHPAAQFAFLSGFAFFLPRLLGGASGAIQGEIGYAGFFGLAGGLSLTAALMLPWVARLRPRGPA